MTPLASNTAPFRGRLEEVGELALSHESQDGGFGHPAILWGYKQKAAVISHSGFT